MATTITLPFTDEFTSLDTELYTTELVGDGEVAAVSGYLRIRDQTAGGAQGGGYLHLPWTAFADDYDIFNRVLLIETKVEYLNIGAGTTALTDLRLAEAKVATGRRYGNGALDPLIRSRTANAFGTTGRVTGTTIPIWKRMIWNGSRVHVEVGARWLAPGQTAFFYSSDGVTYSPQMFHRSGYDLRPNDDHGVDNAVSLFAANYSTFPTFEARFSWLKLQELSVGDGIMTDTAASVKKVWACAPGNLASAQKLSVDGGLTWTDLPGASVGDIIGTTYNRRANFMGDQCVPCVVQPFATGNRVMYVKRLGSTLNLRTINAGASGGGTSFAGDGNANLYRRDSCGLLAFVVTNSAGNLQIDYNYQGFYGSWTTISAALGSSNVNGFWFFSPTLIYVADTNGLRKYTGSWSVVVPGNTGPMHAFNEDQIIVCRYNNADLYEWDGVSWTQRVLPNGAWRPFDVWGVTEASDGEKYWYAQVLAAGTLIAVRKKPGDASWTQYGPAIAASQKGGIHPFGDGTLVMATGLAGPSRAVLYHLASAGAASWTLVDTIAGYFSHRMITGTTLEDVVPPVLQNQNPAEDAEGEPTPVYLEIIDVFSGVDTSTVVISVDPDTSGTKTPVWSSEAAQNGATVATAAVTDGLGYTITLPAALQASTTLRVYVVAYDNNANMLDTFYDFTIAGGKVVLPRSPKIMLGSSDSTLGLNAETQKRAGFGRPRGLLTEKRRRN